MRQQTPKKPAIFALVRFSNWTDPKINQKVMDTSEIQCSFKNSKKLPWRPATHLDFDRKTPYLSVTAIDSSDGKTHPYAIQIHRMSGTKEELELELKASLLAKSSSPEKIKWCDIPDFPRDPDSSSDEYSLHNVGVGLHISAVSAALDRKTNNSSKLQSQNAEMTNYLKSHKLSKPITSVSGLEVSSSSAPPHQGTNSLTSVEVSPSPPEVNEDYQKRIQELEEQLKREREQRSMPPTVTDVVKALQEHMAVWLREQQDFFIQERQKMVAELRADITKEMESIKSYTGSLHAGNYSVPSVSSSHSQASGQPAYKHISEDFRINLQYESQLASAPTVEDFEKLLLQASLENYETYRSRNGKNTKAFPTKWLEGAKAYYINFLRDRKDLGISELEAGIRCGALDVRLSAHCQSKMPRGVHKAKKFAVDNNLDVDLVVAEYKASRPTPTPGKNLGGRPRKRPTSLSSSPQNGPIAKRTTTGNSTGCTESSTSTETSQSPPEDVADQPMSPFSGTEDRVGEPLAGPSSKDQRWSISLENSGETLWTNQISTANSVLNADGGSQSFIK